jgi:serine/threonine-protein kinase
MLDGDSAEARTSLAHVKATQDWDWLGAQQEFLQALALDPRYATAHHWYAMSCLVPLDDLTAAAAQMRQAAALDPVSSIIARDLAMVRYYQRDYDAALEQCDLAIELNPHFSPAYWLLGFIQEQRGDLDESIAAFQRAVTLLPSSPRMQSGLARAMALSGKTVEARQMLQHLESMTMRRYVSPFEFAVVTLALGDPAEAMTWLERAADERAFEMTSLSVDPRLAPLRDEPRFQALARRVAGQLGNRPSATSRSSRA